MRIKFIQFYSLTRCDPIDGRTRLEHMIELLELQFLLCELQ